MTATEALNKFYNGFGMPAYPQNSVPNDVTFPYLTYESIVSSLTGESVNPRVVIWFHTTSEKKVNDKAREISRAIGEGVALASDEGAIYVYKDVWQQINDEADATIKGRFTNLTVVFNTI